MTKFNIQQLRGFGYLAIALAIFSASPLAHAADSIFPPPEAIAARVTTQHFTHCDDKGCHRELPEKNNEAQADCIAQQKHEISVASRSPEAQAYMKMLSPIQNGEHRISAAEIDLQLFDETAIPDAGYLPTSFFPGHPAKGAPFGIGFTLYPDRCVVMSAKKIAAAFKKTNHELELAGADDLLAQLEHMQSSPSAIDFLFGGEYKIMAEIEQRDADIVKNGAVLDPSFSRSAR